MPLHLDWFDLREDPFTVTPDTRYFFLGRGHEEALAHLRFGITERKGFLMVSGEIGTGKTMLCRALLDDLGDGVHTALILNPQLDRDELLRAAAADFGIPLSPGGRVEQMDQLNTFLLGCLSRGENAVLVVDEAQNLSDEALEQVRLVSNLETEQEKLLQIVLVGQPELRERLGTAGLRQLDQRISVRYHLQPLTRAEAAEYVRFRLRIAAGRERDDLFTPAALRAVRRWSRGYPRLINALCDRALLAAYAAGRRQVSRRLVRTAISEMEAAPPRPLRLSALHWAAGAVLLPLVAAALFWEVGLARRAVESFLRAPPGGGEAVRPERPDPPESRPAPPAAPEPPSPAPRVVDDRGVVRVQRVGETLNASLATLLYLWKMDFLAEESRRWRIVNFNSRLLQIFFRETDMSRQYGIGFAAVSPGARRLRTLDLPCIARLRSDGSGPSEHYVVLASLKGGEAVVYDPLAGPRTRPLEAWLREFDGPVYYLVQGGGGAPLRVGSRGSAVMEMQEQLGRAGFFEGEPDGLFGAATRRAVREMQRRHGLDPDGVVGAETRMVLSRISGLFAPTLGLRP